MLTLYYVPRTRAVRVRWMLEELGVPYELHRVDLKAGEHRTTEYLARLHPLGHVPVLLDGDTPIFESGAIIAHPADRFPQKQLAPALGSAERGPYYQWLFYAMTELEPHVQLYSQHTERLPEDRRLPAVADEARRALNANLRALEQALSDGREFLLGRFTAADVVVSGVVGWAFMLRMVDDKPRTQAWSKQLGAREAARRSRAD